MSSKLSTASWRQAKTSKRASTACKSKERERCRGWIQGLLVRPCTVHMQQVSQLLRGGEPNPVLLIDYQSVCAVHVLYDVVGLQCAPISGSLRFIERWRDHLIKHPFPPPEVCYFPPLMPSALIWSRAVPFKKKKKGNSPCGRHLQECPLQCKLCLCLTAFFHAKMHHRPFGVRDVRSSGQSGNPLHHSRACAAGALCSRSGLDYMLFETLSHRKSHLLVHRSRK